MKKVITVRFEGEGPENCYDLKQWDYGVTLRIEGLSLPEKVEVHFALDNSDMAQVYLGTTEDGVTTVRIPAFILENADQIACVSGGKYKAFAYIYQSDEESGWTVRKIIFHIEARQRPEDYVHTEEDLKTWERLENRIGEVDKKKLASPQTAKVGQIFRVQEVNADGTLTLEAVDMPSGGGGAVDDVQVNGTSIVGEDGVAEIPVAGQYQYGVAKVDNKYGINCVDGILQTTPANESLIDYRNIFNTPQLNRPLTPSTIDYFLKAAMCDGKGEAWTSDEQAAARNRMGVGDYELVVDATISEETQNINIETDMFGNKLNLKQSMIIIHTIGTTSNSEEGVISIALFDKKNSKGLILNSSRAFRSSPEYNIRQFVLTFGDYGIVADTSNNVPLFNISDELSKNNNPFKTLGGIYLSGNTAGSNTFGIGSRVIVYGVRA